MRGMQFFVVALYVGSLSPIRWPRATDTTAMTVALRSFFRHLAAAIGRRTPLLEPAVEKGEQADSHEPGR